MTTTGGNATDTLVLYTKVFRGPRHDRLYRIWTAAQGSCLSYIQSIQNPGGYNNTQMLSYMWGMAKDYAQRYVILTEHDFLPHKGFDQIALEMLGDQGMLACRYGVRNPNTFAVNYQDCSGGWFILLDKEKVPEDLDFGGDDPGKQLTDQIPNHVLVTGIDCYPSIEYPFGRHLFWSRHYNDPPGATVAGFPLYSIFKGVDKSIAIWEEMYED